MRTASLFVLKTTSQLNSSAQLYFRKVLDLDSMNRDYEFYSRIYE